MSLLSRMGKKKIRDNKRFYDLQEYPERTPLLGYYDEANPEIADWEIKWAVEHGINCFIYCWYRYRENLGKPVTREALRLGYALHEGFLNARYQDYMKFAFMFECTEFHCFRILTEIQKKPINALQNS